MGGGYFHKILDSISTLHMMDILQHSILLCGVDNLQSFKRVKFGPVRLLQRRFVSALVRAVFIRVAMHCVLPLRVTIFVNSATPTTKEAL